MTNLKELVFNQIDQLGEMEAAEKFGKSLATIKLWRATGNIPLAVVQMVLNEQPAEELPTEIALPTGELNDPAPSQIEEILARLEKLEDFARMMTDPDLKRQNSTIRPLDAVAKTYVPNDNRAIREGPTMTGPTMSGVNQEAPFTPAIGKTALIDTDHPVTESLPQTYGEDWNRPYPKDYRSGR